MNYINLIQSEKQDYWQLQAVTDFWGIKKGQLGGLIHKTSKIDTKNSVWIGKDPIIEANCVIESNCYIKPDCTIEYNCIIGINCIIGVNCVIEENCHLSSNSRIPSNCKLTKI